MAPTLVIKVKYGDTLRRFNARVNENNQLDLDVAGLRAKILSLFNFSTHANFMLRYVDEDGDLVTLVNDEDLHDVMRQKLKFLRIDVHISNENDGKYNASSRVNAIPLRSPPVKNPSMSGNDAIADVLKSLPEPLPESLSNNISLNMASKTASPGPVPRTPADNISKMIQSLLDSDCQVEDGSLKRVVAKPIAPVDPNSSQLKNVNTAPVSSAVPDGDGKEGEMATVVKNDICSVSTSYAAPDNSSTLTTAVGSSHTETMGGMFHKGFCCDGCGIYIIEGLHFESKVKQNYNLCSICYKLFSNETDYIRMDPPICNHSPQSFKGVYKHPSSMSSSSVPQFLQKGVILKHVRPKLDSRFTFDVNVKDGTMMAPSTAFTKIWRMCNNGTIVWPKGTQLAWIGGDKFSDFHSVNLEIPADGMPVGKEFDIVVDFRAPQLPGKYISYWRMASPTGERFGQRVWVLIEVDDSLNESLYNSSQGLNLNIPLDGSGSNGPKDIDINIQPIVDDASLQSCNSNASTEPERQMVDKQPRQELENNFPIYETTSIGHVIDLSEAALAVPVVDDAFPQSCNSNASTQPEKQLVDSQISSASSSLVDKIELLEMALLEELEEMGYEYSPQQSLDDLCGVSVWDPIIGRVKGNGFRLQQNE